MYMEKKTKKPTVFFTVSTSKFSENRHMYRDIIEQIEKLGFYVKCNISLSEFDSEIVKHDMDEYSNSNTYFPTMKKVTSADFVVADCTVPSMTTGHIVTHALSVRKPTLVLTAAKKDDEQNLFIFGNESPLLSYAVYYKKDVQRQLKGFFRKHTKQDRVRLNFVVDKDTNDRLSWLSFRTKKSKTDIIKEALNNYSEG